jgi:diguanylate cyclase (GGDEF)-like protein
MDTRRTADNEGVARETITRARKAFDPGPDPYAQLDVGLATKLGGALYLIGVAYAAIVLPMSPPSGPLGALGAGLCMLVATAIGVALLRRRDPADPSALLALCFVGIAIATAFRASAGPGSPFLQLLLLATMYTCAVHPAGCALPVLFATTLAAVSPVLYEDVAGDFAALTTSHLALTWSLAGIILIWTTRVRGLRREVQAAREEAERHARIDALTGLGNRRALEEALAAAVAHARRHGAPLSVLVADLDGFKSVNDSFGHQAGDEMLRAAARAFTSAVRVPDPCFRWGGDEFVALLPGAGLAEAQEIAARVQTTVALSCRRPDARPLRISAGAAELRSDETGADVVARADAELLELKRARRTAPLPAAG